MASGKGSHIYISIPVLQGRAYMEEDPSLFAEGGRGELPVRYNVVPNHTLTDRIRRDTRIPTCEPQSNSILSVPHADRVEKVLIARALGEIKLEMRWGFGRAIATNPCSG